MNDRKWKRTRGSYLLYAACLGLLLSLAPTAVQGGGRGKGNPNPGIFPPTSHPYGLTYGEWSAVWWQRAADTPVYDFPCDGIIAESGNVLILNASGGEPIEFTCTVPPGKSLLFPILTAAYWCPIDCGEGTVAPNGTVEELRAAAAATIDLLDPATEMWVDIDGVPLENLGLYRFASPVFSGVIDPDSLFGDVFGDVIDQGVADGYWMMVHPLPPGDHVIHFGADLSEFGLVFDTTINLTVAPPGHDD